MGRHRQLHGAGHAAPAGGLSAKGDAAALPIRQYSGSLTKEPPLSLIDRTILLIRPGMAYSDLLSLASEKTNSIVPGLLRARFLLLDGDRIVYDRFLSLVNSEGAASPRVRKSMFLLWALRDPRLRGFILEKVADANGRWRTAELTRKANSAYFEQWHQSSSAAKIRSNIEFFLVEARTLNSKVNKADLNISDAWLPEALIAAAQHAVSEAAKATILRDPVGFLFDNQLHGLVNLTSQDRVAASRGQPVAVELLNDELAAAWSAEPSALKDWTPRIIKPGSSSKTAAILDPLALERANSAHQQLEQIVADAALTIGLQPRCSDSVDMLLETQHGYVVLEMKSCTEGNFHAQIRRAVSQLLEYRFIYREQLGNASLVVVAETQPPKEKKWLVGTLSLWGLSLPGGGPAT